MSCKLGMRALPPRSPKLTKPSRHGQISRALPICAPDRLPRNGVRKKRPMAPMLATRTVSCIETSTCCGTPLARAVRAAVTASGEPWQNATGSAHRTGSRSGSPVAKRLPVVAIVVRSLAIQSLLGPSAPNGVTSTHTAPGASSGDGETQPGQPGVASTTSAVASNSARSSSRALVLWAPQASSRVPSKLGATRTTSAPRSARRRPAIAAGSPARSRTRTELSRRWVTSAAS